MATIDTGINGGFRGKVGSVVGILRGDKYHMRSLPIRKKAYTAAELANQEKFRLVQKYLDPLKEILKVGFKNYYTPTGGIRAAFAYTRKMAVAADESGYYIDPALFKISGGDLQGAVNPSFTLEADNHLIITWNNSPMTAGDPFDQIIVLVYDTTNFRAEMRLFEGTFRSAGEYTITIPTGFKGSEVDIHIGFIAADRSAQSDSQYLGRLTVPL